MLNLRTSILILACAISLAISVQGKSAAFRQISTQNSPSSGINVANCVIESGMAGKITKGKLTKADGHYCEQTDTDLNCFLELDVKHKFTVNYKPNVAEITSAQVRLAATHSKKITNLAEKTVPGRINDVTGTDIELEFTLASTVFQGNELPIIQLQLYVDAPEFTEGRTCNALTTKVVRNTAKDIGGNCQILDEPCSFPLSNCTGTTKTCACATGTLVENKKCKQPIDGPCQLDADDCLENGECVEYYWGMGTSYNCECKTGYYQVSKEECRKNGALSYLTIPAFVFLLQLVFVRSSGV